jgi:AcrR family transcriptional regulator
MSYATCWTEHVTDILVYLELVMENICLFFKTQVLANIRYVFIVTRQADTAKKPAMLEQIVDYLVDKPLSALTFRGLAAALGVSSFTLVYHFGTRDELVRDIITAIATRQRGFETVFAPSTITVAAYFEGLRQTFDLTLSPRNRALQRLEFEAQMLEAVAADHALTRNAHEELRDRARDALVALGIAPERAALEGQLLIDTFYGIQVGLVVSGDVERATASFERALQYHRDQIEPLIQVP